MVEENMVTEKVANGTSLPEKTVKAATEKKEEQNGIKEMEEDKKIDKSETAKMDEDKESKEETEKEESEEQKTEAMEEDASPSEKEATELKDGAKDEVEGEADVDKKKEDKDEEKAESKAAKGSKKRGKGKSEEKVKEKTKKVEEKKDPEPRTPATDRPVRERKSVERLVASIEKEAVKEFQIEKGRGTPLKDIPNVAFKLSRRKTDDSFKLLHTILFGRRGKAVQVKNNISRFSGFVWHENEEKQMIKVKEKFDKCNKEKLLEFCDVLDIPIAKATTRKEDIVAKLIEFLVAPYATTTVLLAEKEKSSKASKKRKRVVRESSLPGNAASKRSAKNRIKTEETSKMEEKKSSIEAEDESEEEKQEDEENEEEENENCDREKSKDEVSEHSENEEKTDSEDESEEDVRKHKRSSRTSSRKESPGKAKSKKITVPNKSNTAPKKKPNKSSSKRSKVDDDNGSNRKVFSRKRKNDKVAKEKASTPARSAFREKSGKRVAKRKDKVKEEKLKPNDDELRDATCEILKEVDFNTATFTDILKQLAQRFDTDLTPRKSSIKLMIQEELTKLADEADDDEDGEGDAEKDENQSASQEVET